MPRATDFPHFRRALVVSAAVIVVVILVGTLLRASPGWTAGEMDLLRRISLHHTPVLDALALGINAVFGPSLAILLIGGCALVVVQATRRVRSGAQFIVVTVLVWVGNEAIKVIVHRPRPDIASLAHPLVLHPGGLSFTSGHTSLALSLMLGIVVVTTGHRARRVAIVAAVVVGLVVAGSRVYLGVHYPTDVIGSLVYSTAAVALANALWIRFVVPHWTDRRSIAIDATTVHREGARDAR